MALDLVDTQDLPELDMNFWKKVDITLDGCWNWKGGRKGWGYEKGGGYGSYKNRKANRYAFLQMNGYEPPVVMHTCDNPLCCSPFHLVAGTHAENMADRNAKGRQASKLTASDVRTIRLRALEDGVTRKELAMEYGVDVSNIGHILTRRTWKHLKEDLV